MLLKYFKLVLLTGLSSYFLFGCSNIMDVKSEDEDLLKHKIVTVLLNDKKGPKTNYKMTVSTNGIQTETVATFPSTTTTIVKNGQHELEVTLGAMYTIKLHRTSKETIEEFYKETKKEPEGDVVAEKPLVEHTFMAEEDIDLIELEVQ